MITKRCKCCDKNKSISEFHKHKGRNLGVTDCCKPCRNTKIVEKRYNLVDGGLEELKIKQDFKCAICKEETNLAVDHCHNSTKVRGLLCNNCNNGLGRFKDSIELLENAIKYLKNE